jgi:hypothetical protein
VFHPPSGRDHLAAETAICNSATALAGYAIGGLLIHILPFTGCLVADRNPIEESHTLFFKS